ncbi:hypothetical protein T11_15516 [Trichinella zimbabwensis]|uniref:Uncharacterized protein n=1 Tax=Trichinella zimbabwensis TaxID=268475 RepID=A0A0V1GM44_9BILA|nr:hypothetical protein T11_15516 [Trichinella zimbabwensis]
MSAAAHFFYHVSNSSLRKRKTELRNLCMESLEFACLT